MIFNNIDQVFKGSIKFWIKCFDKMIAEAIEFNQELDPCKMVDGFSKVIF